MDDVWYSNLNNISLSNLTLSFSKSFVTKTDHINSSPLKAMKNLEQNIISHFLSNYRRQKEKRINPACASPPLGFSSCHAGDISTGAHHGNMYTASMSSLPTSTQNTLTSLHPLALMGAGLSNVARAVNAASTN